MTEPQTPATEAGRRHLVWLLAGDDVFEDDARATVLAIEGEARAEHWNEGYRAGYSIGRADALREAADAVRALHIDPVYLTLREVLAILDPETTP